jgi:hypothetical protein
VGFCFNRSCFRRSRWRLSLAAGLLFWTPWAGSQVVALRETTEVSGATIRLSELLPLSSPLALREASDAIELGRSPQPGSARALEAAQIARALIKRPDLLRQLAIPDRILVRRSGWMIQRGAIRDAVGRFLRAKSDYRDLSDSALQSPGDLAAREENPALEVTGILRDVRGQGSELRLRCVQRSLCSSFVVHLFDPQPSSPDWSGDLHSATHTLASRPPLPVAAKETGLVLAEAGRKAMLQLGDGQMSISLQVICLERGQLLQTIRVLDASSHRVLRAEVVGVGKLHASL